MDHNQGEHCKDRYERSCYRFHPHRHFKIGHRNGSSCFALNWPNAARVVADLRGCARKTETSYFDFGSGLTLPASRPRGREPHFTTRIALVTTV